MGGDDLKAARSGGSNALSLREYLDASRRPSFSAVMVISLLALYEAGIALTEGGQRNAADVIIKQVLADLGDSGGAVFHVGLLVSFLLAAVILNRRGGSVFRYLVPFLAECSVYACCLAPFVLWLEEPFLALPASRSLVLDVGAGVYEEILFRLILIRGLFLLMRLDPWEFFRVGEKAGKRFRRMVLPAGVVAVVSAGLFALYHHLGPGGEPIEMSVLIFRFLAGLVLVFIYLARGLGVVVYTHALYDILVHVTRS